MKLLLILTVVAVGFIYWRKDRGQPHASYFQQLQALLKKHGVCHPRLVIDLDRMDANIEQVRRTVGDTSTIRLVAKSLPSFELLEYLQKQLGTSRVMVFHQPFLSQMLDRFPAADFLIGKPFPVAGVRKLLDESEGKAQDASRRVKWLVDSQTRLEQYLALATEKQLILNIAVELDVGLHRGGVGSCAEFRGMAQLIADNPEYLKFSGFMGYEPHLSKLTGLLLSKRETAREKILQRYQTFVDVVRDHFPSMYRDDLCLNSGGSMTYSLYPKGDSGPVNELAIGSAFVKPADFDLDTLSAHQPAAFVVTPVLKVINRLQLPLLEKLNGIWELITPNMSRAIFTYGGWWKARPVSPEGLCNHFLYGRSTNQELLTGSESTGLKADDFVFLRPSQSEHVFLQFGQILAVRKDQVVGEWSTFNQNY